jgi:DNA-binding winged helix-turn-helix (wHTH) protein
MNLLNFGPFTLDMGRRVLLREGTPVALTPKTYETLALLVRNSERVVEKSELMDALWPDAVVEENNLNQQISALRKVLGDRAEEGRYIRTVPDMAIGSSPVRLRRFRLPSCRERRPR